MQVSIARSIYWESLLIFDKTSECKFKLFMSELNNGCQEKLTIE